MSWAMVHAEFKNVKEDERAKIYELLEKYGWVKIKTKSVSISTIWKASFKDHIKEEEVFAATLNEFLNSSKSFCVPTLVMSVSPMEPRVFEK